MTMRNIVMVSCALIAGCGFLEHGRDRDPRAEAADEVLEEAVATDLALESEGPISMAALAWPRPHDTQSVLVAWGAMEYGAEGSSRVHVAELDLDTGAAHAVAELEASGWSPVEPQLALVGDRVALSWSDDEGIHLVTDVRSTARHQVLGIGEPHRRHALATTRDAILVGWEQRGETALLPMLTRFDARGDLVDERILGTWAEDDRLELSDRAVVIASTPDSGGVAGWMKRTPTDYAVELLRLDASGVPMGEIVTRTDDVTVGWLRNLMLATATRGGVPSVLATYPVRTEDGVARRVLRWNLDSETVTAGESLLAIETTELSGLSSAMPLAAAVRVEDRHDPDYLGCALPPIVQSELLLEQLGDPALAPMGEPMQLAMAYADEDEWAGSSLIQSPQVLSLHEGFVVLWVADDILFFRRAVR